MAQVARGARRLRPIAVLAVVFFVGCNAPAHVRMAPGGPSLNAADEFYLRLCDRCKALGCRALYEGSLGAPPFRMGLRHLPSGGQWYILSYQSYLEVSPVFGPPPCRLRTEDDILFRLKSPPASSETVAITVKGEQMVFSVEKVEKSWLLPNTETSVLSLLQSCSDDQWPLAQ